QATEAEGCAAATTVGFSPANSASSASMSPGNKIGSGPRRSRVDVMRLLCRATPPHQTRRRVAKLQSYFESKEDSSAYGESLRARPRPHVECARIRSR